MTVRWLAGKEESESRARGVSQLKRGSVVHLGGICGTGMSAVASLLKQLGYQIRGSDKAFYPPMGDLVRSLTKEIFEGYRRENLDQRPDLVVIGNNLRRDNPEVLRVMEEGIPYASMPEVFAGLLIGDRDHVSKSIVVSGTHGKTTTSGAITVLFERAGWSPGYFIGGVPNDLATPVRPPNLSLPLEKRVVVLEGDEYDSAFFAKWPKFHSYRPDILVVTSLEFDHADIYSSVEEIEAEFTELVKSVPQGGHVLVCNATPRLRDLVAEWKRDARATVSFYGEEGEAEYRITRREPTSEGQHLEFDLAGERVEVKTPLSGVHNALNLLVTAAVGRIAGLHAQEIQEGARSFRGVLRRQSVIGERGGITVIEDFAHHPTAIGVTLDGLREAYAGRRIVAVYEPRSNTARRNFYQEQYPSSFRSADVVVMLEIQSAEGYSNTASEIVPLDVPRIIRELQDAGKEACSFPAVQEIDAFLQKNLRAGDVAVCMTNGDFGGLLGSLKGWLVGEQAKELGVG